MFLQHSQLESFTGITRGGLFRFQGDRKVYEMVDGDAGKYKRRRQREILTFPHQSFSDLLKTKVVRVTECNDPTPQAAAAFDAVHAVCQQIGWPQHYVDDVMVGDRATIYNHNPRVFGWSVRDTGSWLMLPNNTFSLFLCEHLERERAARRDHSRHFLWNGSALQECKTLELIESKLLAFSVDAARQYAQCTYDEKNSHDVKNRWQTKIDAEVALKNHVTA